MDLPGNSNTGKEAKRPAPDKPATEKEELQPLPLSGEAVRKKKPLGQKFREVFFGGDFKGTMKTVASVTIAPAIRNLVFDTGVEALKRTIFPNMAPGSRPSSTSLASRITYHTPVNRDPREDPRRDPRTPAALPGASTDVGDIGFTMREDAEMVLDGLIEKIDRHRFVTVRDLYTLLGWATNYTDEYRGWSQLGEVQIIQTREGYILRLPRTEVR
jgi:hypothetical protein